MLVSRFLFRYVKIKATMPKKTKRPWTRGEKWLIVTPVFVLLCAWGMTFGKEMLRRQMLWPKRIIRLPEKENLRLFSVSKDNKIVANAGDYGPLHIYNLETGEHLTELNANFSKKRNGPWSCRFIPVNQHVAFCYMDGPIEIWNIETQSFEKFVGSNTMKMDFTPDGKTAATSYYELWDVKQNRLQTKLLKASTDVSPVFSADGQLLALRGPTKFIFNRQIELRKYIGGEVWIWQVKSGQLKYKLPAHMADKYDFSPDSQRLVCIEQIMRSGFGVSGYNLKVFDVSSQRELWKLTTPPKGERWSDAKISPNGKWIAVSTHNDYIEVRDAANGDLKLTLHGKWRDTEIDGNYMMPPGLQFTHDEKYLVYRARHEIRIWDVREIEARLAL